MRYLRGPLVALVTFLIGCAVSPIQFEVIRIACGKLDGGGGFSSTVLRSSDNVEVFVMEARYGSLEKNNEAFDRNIAEAVRVIEITPKLDEHGNVVGRRAVTIHFVEDRNEHFASVFWTDGSPVLHYIDSPSLKHVLEVERRRE